jgi:hypothetical protein
MFRIILGGMVALLVPTLLAAPNADAANRFAMTCVENRTKITLNYRVRWGDGSWSRSSVGPGRRISHTYRYPPGKEGKAPTLTIGFDDDLSAEATQREYQLESYSSPQKTDCIRYGREYQFRYDGTAKNFIDLVSIR